MFGQPGNASFSGFNSAAQTSPFGQSAFGKPITTTSFGSGTTPVFGSGNTSLFSSKPAGSTTGGLFGNTNTPPAFRQTTNTQPSFGGFGTTSTNTNLFGTQQNAGTNLFGTSTATSTFGQPNKPAGFSFGASTNTNLFGQPQQPAQQTTPFGQTNTTTNTNLFGTTGFGNQAASTSMTGTVIKFTPVITTDSMSKNGITHNISARHCCIVAMKEYESKSYEELRFEDYSVGRKGPGQGTGTGLFGAPAQPSPFGNTAAGTSTTNTGFGGMATGFGATSQSGTTGLFAKPITSFGVPATTTANNFAFNSSGTTNLFGTNTQAKPFGTAAPTPLFATSNTNQTAGTGFGGINTAQNTGFGSTFGSTQPNQSIGLFNQNKSAFNIPSTSTGTGFPGFGQTPASNTGTNLFGTKTTGTAGFGNTSTFGTAAPSTFGTNTGFGATQNTGTSLFNSSFKPAGQTGGFSFGSTPAPSTGLGTNTGLGLGGGSTLFGQQKPGGLFGNTTNNTTFNTPGTFGSSSTFGANNSALPGLGTSLLGNNVTTNQVKNSGSVPVHQQILALVSAPFGDSPLLKNLLPASGKTEELLKPTSAAAKILNSPQYKVTSNKSSPKIKTRVVNSAQLTKKSLFEGLEEEDPVLSEAFHPRPNAKRLVLRPKPITNTTVEESNENLQSVSRNGINEDESEVTTVYSNGIEHTNKENHIQENNRQPSNDRRSSSASWLKSTLPRKTKVSDDEHFEGQRSPFSGTASEETINNTVAELRPNSKQVNQSQSDLNASLEATSNSSFCEKNSTEITLHNSDSSQEGEENSFSVLQSNWCTNLAKVTLRRVGYYTIPPLDKLDEFVCGETCIVPNFTVGREGYGNVYFPDSFDVYGLNLDEIVHFRHKEVIIYPDDEKKPPVGQGLNRKAQVTLDRVWPHDKSLHEPITDPHRLAAMNYEGKLRRVSAKHDTRFLEYRPETGSWVFKVDHFSKYGLSDSDEDDNVPPNPDLKKLKGTVPKPPQKALGKLEEPKPANKDALNGITSSAKIGNGKHPDIGANFLGDTMGSGTLPTRDYDSEGRVHVSPSTAYARMAGTDSHKLQLMKASFFDMDSEDNHEELARDVPPTMQKSISRGLFGMDKSPSEHQDVTSIYAPVLRSDFTMSAQFSMDEDDHVSRPASKLKWSEEAVRAAPSVNIRKFPEPVVNPVTTVLKYHSEVVPFSKSIINKARFRCVADTGILMGRMFKVSWGPGLTLLSLSTQDQASKMALQSKLSQLGSYVSGRLLGDNTSATIVQRLQILGGNGADEQHVQLFKESVEAHLRIQLNHCIMGQEGDCPVLGVSTDTPSIALHKHCALAEELADQFGDRSMVYSSIVWKLCVALWGNLPDIIPSAEKSSHHNVMVRKEAVGDWLKSVVQDTVEQEIMDVSLDEQKVLSLLTALKLEEACERAREVGDHCLALLMSQLRSGLPVKQLVKQQLALWQETDVDEYISMHRLKLFMLVAGEPLIASKHGTINVCENLDWKRALAVHLWYLSSPTASITDVLDLYEASFDAAATEVYAAPPTPEYKESDYDAEIDGKPTYDLCYHLLKLYCTGNHSLSVILNPLSHTADPLDYRLSWLVQQTLTALGYSHLSDHVAALTHVNFATQLEAFGLWHWAIFVMLHLQDTARRRTAVLNLLERHIEIDDDPECVKREEFLREELGIPPSWIHRAKAVKSRVSKRYGEAAWYYIQAEQWNVAHEIIIEHLAADAIINENYDYLRSLLKPLLPEKYSSTISGWAHQGQLLWDYMEITLEIKSLLKTADTHGIGYKLELLKPRLTGLCFKINQFPCPTAKHRLCQAEIAKRSLHLAKNLLLLPSGESASTTKVLVQLISQLPLPEDYAQQELRPLVNMRVNEVMVQSV